MVEDFIRLFGDTAEPFWDEIGAQYDVPPTGEEITVGYIPLLNANGEPEQFVLARVSDYERIVRETGEFFDDRVDFIDLVDMSDSTTADTVSFAAGQWLVRETIVPITATVWLFGSGLIGLIGLARRKS